MCFVINNHDKKKLIRRFKRNGGVLYFYKVLLKANQSPYYNQIYHGGWNKPKSFTNSFVYEQIEDSYRAHHGLYVFLTKRSALADYDRKNEKIIKVKCLLKDLLYAGEGNATFSKVWIDRKELQ